MNRFEELYHEAKSDKWFQNIIVFAASPWQRARCYIGSTFGETLEYFLFTENLHRFMKFLNSKISEDSIVDQ